MKRSLLILIAATTVLYSCTRRPVQNDIPVNRSSVDHLKMDHSKMVSSPGAESAPYELQFIDTMILHHQGAIDAAQLVATRAQHDELKQLAASIIADQQREIAQMKQWRAAWFGDAAPAVNFELPGMKEGMHGMDLEKLDGLKENGFDLEFIDQMIPHHEGAVTMAKDLLTRDAHPELRELAENIVRSQSDEIDRMRSWQKEWKR
jgi:uncharacterized protein (DUF305 family)